MHSRKQHFSNNPRRKNPADLNLEDHGTSPPRSIQ